MAMRLITRIEALPNTGDRPVVIHRGDRADSEEIYRPDLDGWRLVVFFTSRGFAGSVWLTEHEDRATAQASRGDLFGLRWCDRIEVK